ncbi:MAG TPA: VCBS repeat-containing protein [Pyrinomonadaceae bacterium]
MSSAHTLSSLSLNRILGTHRRTSLSVGALSLLLIFALASRSLNAASSTVFSNPSSIAINSSIAPPSPAVPYPSTINVSGLTGATTKVTVTLTGINDFSLPDIDVLLVSPTGGKIILMSDAGFNAFVFNGYVILDDAAPTSLGSVGFSSGTYKPTNIGGGDSFPAPAPVEPYSTTLAAAFNGVDPNGAWSLYIVDDQAGVDGTITQGWTLNVTTSGMPATSFSNSGYIRIDDGTMAATPYPSTIEVSGLSGVLTNLKVTLRGLSHTRVADVDIMLVSPNGHYVVLMSDLGESADNAILTFDDAAPTFLPNVITSGTYKPSNGDDISSAPDLFPDPAPPIPYGQNGYGTHPLSGLYGFSPNGRWSLYIMDDSATVSGSLSGGWSLEIATEPYIIPSVGCDAASFSAPVNYAAGSVPGDVAAGDFNHDNKQDIVVTNQSSNSVSLLLGGGTGGFSSPASFAVGTSPAAVVVGDFNTDANQDLAVVNTGSNNVSILLGDGAGGFSEPTNFSTETNPLSVAVADFNNDTHLDLAVAESGGSFSGVSVLYGNGRGRFGAPFSFAAHTQPVFVATGEFNGDHYRDLAVANFGSNDVSILLNTANGLFAAAPLVSVGVSPISIAVADFNRDGNSDLAVANYNSFSFSLRLGTGDGAFTGNLNPDNIGNRPVSIKAVDLHGNSNPLLIVANSGSHNVSALFNVDGSFGSSTNFNLTTTPGALVVGDFNHDGKADIVTANSGSNNISVLLNVCSLAKDNRFDFTGDGKTDVIVFRPSAGSWYFLGAIPFGSSTDIIVPADYDGNGRTDVAYFSPGTARWVALRGHNLFFGLAGDVPVPADYDGDGRADIAVFRPADGFWHIRRSTDNSVLSIPFGTSEDKPVARDYDGDGKADLAVFRPSNGVWYILQSSDGQVRAEHFGLSQDRPVAADYDGDGKADLAVFRPSNGVWYILRSSDNSLAAQAWGANLDVPVPGDYDGDGKFDVAVWRPSIGYWYVLPSSTGIAQGQAWGIGGDIPLPSAYIP